MAKLITLGSSSSGNAYILECDNEQLIIELGVSWKEIMKGLNYDITKVRACLTSHIHKDHSKSIPNAIKYGLQVVSCVEVRTIHPQVKVLKKGVKMRLGGFKVQAIPLQHNCECYGYLIEHNSISKLIFATDCNSVPYRFKNVNHFVIECNYDADILIDNMCNNVYSQSASENHLELNDTIEFLKQNYSSALQSVTLIHLSNGNINAETAKQRVKDELGFDNVYVADKGLIVELNKDDF